MFQLRLIEGRLQNVGLPPEGRDREADSYWHRILHYIFF